PSTAIKAMKEFGLDEMAKAYMNINNTDAQAIMTLDAYVIHLDGLGKLTTEVKAYIKKVKEGKDLTKEELKKAFALGPLKPVYVEDHLTDNNLYQRTYLKYSVFPLIPQILNLYPDLNQLNTEMINSNTDMLIFESGVKIGGKN